MENSELNRLSRLTALLIQLQTKNLVTATELAEKFQVSKRTIYRDLKSLENAGVPIITEEGKGYSLMQGYTIPPVMFTEKEANALILAEQLVLQNKDASFLKDYKKAIDKIKSIIDYKTKDKLNLLTTRTQYNEVLNQERNSNNLSELQYALTNFHLVTITYTNKEGLTTKRSIEPFALVNTENWYLIAWCRLREEFRFFRPDRIQDIEVESEKFIPHKLTLQEFFEKKNNGS